MKINKINWKTIWVVYGAIALIVILPMLLPGYIFTLDMVFTPQLPAPAEISSQYIYREILHLLNFVIPSQIIQKLMLFSILLLSGVSFYKFLESLKKASKQKYRIHSICVTSFCAGLFFMINPFTYSRFMTGQIGVLMGYALLPWFAMALFRFIAKPNWRNVLILSAWAVAISILSLHILGMAILLAAVAFIFALLRLYRTKNKKQLLNLLKFSAAGAGLILVASSYWIIPALTGNSSTVDQISYFDDRHLVSFRTDSGTLPVPLNVLSLNGFWGDREGFYLLPRDVLPFWYAIFAGMVAIMIAGAVKAYKNQRFVTLVLLTTLFIAWVLSQGVVSTPYRGINYWLYENIPLFTGYREPGKFIALIAFAEAYLFSFGLSYLLVKIRKHKPILRGWVIGVAFGLIFLYTPSMLWGFGGQLKPTNYPSDWKSTNEYLIENNAKKTLFLPWHQYMYFNFSEKLMANPAKRYFETPVIQGDNAEIGLIARQSYNPESAFIEKELLPNGDKTNIGKKLQSIGVEYVILAKEVDWKKYSYLDKQADLKKIKETENLILYMTSQ